MGFASVKEWLNKQTSNAKDSVTRFKNKEFMDACVAGCALVAAADGNIDATEKQTMAEYINRSEELKVFDMHAVIKRFNHYADNFAFNQMIGKGEALKAIAKIKKNAEAGRLLVRVCCAIGMADGDFDQNEKSMVRDICTELGLPPNDFGL
ncbi:MAG: tellurite resistance TerB family protein [Gammaproteobacteria bacterium]|nr:tellurite resistance TerB family protein [Gammaproteobacteria bacterium]